MIINDQICIVIIFALLVSVQEIKSLELGLPDLDLSLDMVDFFGPVSEMGLSIHFFMLEMMHFLEGTFLID